MTNLDRLLEETQKKLHEKEEELVAQRGMLTLSLNELDAYNQSLTEALGKLKDRNSELEQLLYQSSHGLRSPLTSIQGIVDLMEYEQLSVRTEEYRQHVKRKVLSMAEILNSLTTYSQLLTDQVKSELTHIDDIVVSCTSYFHDLAKQKNVNLQFRSEVQSPVIFTDPFLINAFLKQIIMNSLLFRNSAAAGMILLDIAVKDKMLMIRVEDDGDGIDQSLGESIFKMFFRGSEKSEGSGLGLFIAKKAVDMLKGTITFVSRPGRTVFEIRIPASA